MLYISKFKIVMQLNLEKLLVEIYIHSHGLKCNVYVSELISGWIFMTAMQDRKHCEIYILTTKDGASCHSSIL